MKYILIDISATQTSNSTTKVNTLSMFYLLNYTEVAFINAMSLQNGMHDCIK